MKKYVIVLSCLFHFVLCAQDTIVAVDTAALRDSTRVAFIVHQQPVNVMSVRIRKIQSGARSDTPDSTIARIYPAGTLADLLGGGGYLNLKSYGPGALSTTASRGSNSMQMPIVWNGINLQNITNNTVDLSLMPTFLFDHIGMQPGNSSTAIGSGAIGGSINLGTLIRAYSPSGRYLYAPYIKSKAVLEYGSFGAAMGGVQFGFGVKKWTGDVKLYRQIAQNNFNYINTAVIGGRKEKLAHAEMQQHGFLAQIGYDPGTRHAFSLRLWVQETKRNIPPTMLQSINESTQQDYACRLVGDWHWTPRERLYVTTRAAMIHEGLVYDPGYSQAINNTTMWTGLFSTGINYYFGSHQKRLRSNWVANAVATGMWSLAEVTGYVPRTEQIRLTFAGGVGKYIRNNDEFNISGRIEAIDGNFISPVGSLWYYLEIKKWIAIRASVSNNYRVPTFNDLYWVPGGNPNLKAETSWTEELTLELKYYTRNEDFHIEYSVTTYNRNIENMITWVPLAAYWSPQNIAEVQSYGMEHRFKTDKQFGRLKLKLTANADYVRSEYRKSENPDDVSIGKQLIYVPAWFGGGSFTVQFTDYYITYTHQYTDLRFTTRDHLEYLPAYDIAGAAAGWSTISTYNGAEYGINLFFRCNNILDEQYQAVAWRPMPGRSYVIGCSVQFSRILKQIPND